ncbi:L-rhamnonate dehydratase [Rubrobacter xylanophilus DSM 9941]|uniref:enolase C-terminal domain-like protein n=1 Tax=Rubrobacter xylanophilus TaxID=49319 RepID=UPI001C63ED2E|nr:enolase C-terminal domain-like protein [Rubrobacter xylanophilus]QYJ15766.1 L-rhamnonate dehydratase [Rubrobacter xylanophilus DSM 9941]
MSAPKVEEIEVLACKVPTDAPESDGTLEWDSTTMVLVEAHGGGEKGLGYTYGDVSVGRFITSKLAGVAEGSDALSPPAVWARMQAAIRNAGRPGVGAMAVSAVDVALWDLKAKLLGVPLADALPRFHERVPVYGSGGFTSYSLKRLQEQLGGWVAEGIPRVKMKVGREPERDRERVRAAREAVGEDVELMVDANGAYKRKQALYWAEAFARESRITYLEEPVSSEDREGLRMLRDRGPGGVAIAAGEYEWTLAQLFDLAGCVDILQADVTRCGGITNLLRVDGICRGHQIPFSAHCAPAISAHACCAMESLLHLEYFHDHVRVERLLFEGTLTPEDGRLRPDPDRSGLGLELKRSEAERYAA